MAEKKKTKSPTKRGFLADATIWTYLGYGLTTLLALFLLVLMVGERFGILDYLGLRWVFSEQSGVYADCSKPENAKVPYCQPKKSANERQWDDMRRGGKALPFNLHD